MLIVCPKCKEKKIVKAGFIHNRQRYKCKSCGYHFSGDNRSKPLIIKRLAIIMYLEGRSIRSLSKTLGVSNVAALQWLNEYASGIKRIRPAKSCIYSNVRFEELVDYLRNIPDKQDFTWCLLGMGNKQSQVILLR